MCGCGVGGWVCEGGWLWSSRHGATMHTGSAQCTHADLQYSVVEACGDASFACCKAASPLIRCEVKLPHTCEHLINRHSCFQQRHNLPLFSGSGRHAPSKSKMRTSARTQTADTQDRLTRSEGCKRLCHRRGLLGGVPYASKLKAAKTTPRAERRHTQAVATSFSRGLHGYAPREAACLTELTRAAAARSAVRGQ